VEPELGSAARDPGGSRLPTFARSSLAAVARHVDLELALGFAALTLLSRWPYRARMLYNWDAVQFALALREFDRTRPAISCTSASAGS
jgi:hypothetical protein